MTIIWRDGPDPEAYEEARTARLFNRQIPERYPLAIAFAKSESDVVDAVKLATEKNCQISIRAGGHSWPAWSVRDEAILLDLGDHREISLDEQTGVVRVSPSTTGKELVDYLCCSGRTISVGHCPGGGLGGFLLAGGMGWNCNNWGWACEQLVAVDLVTASGELVHANQHQRNDLLWAAKGAGPGFPGVVTRFHLRTRLTPKVMRSSEYVYRMSHYRAAFDWILKVRFTEDDNVEIIVNGRYSEDIKEVCITISVIAFGDEEDTVKTALQRAESSYPPGLVSHSFCKGTNFQELFEVMAKGYPPDHYYFVDNAFLANDADVVGTLEPAFALPTKTSVVLWSSMKPYSRRPLPDMAVSLQSDHFCGVYGICKQEEDVVATQNWVRGVMAKVAKHSIGAYLGEFDFQERRSRFWGEAQRRKLMEIRSEWDPDQRICGYLGLEYTVD
ncbi:hypothetical protein FQN52_000414 [Onygenales sp. PD_12]|nr:hypothetical protein FQN52_000414 [Onygenales sp. PD_12]